MQNHVNPSTLATAGDHFPGSAFPSPLYRIPALTQSTTGRLIACYDVRSDWRDLPAEFDIGIRTSDDLGQTWSSPRPLHQHSQNFGVGDASLLTDKQTGRIFCWHVASTGESFFSAVAGGAGLQLWLSYSDTDGETWHHRNMSRLRPPDIAGMFTSSGNGTIDESGVLYQTFVCRVQKKIYSCCARSKDHGESWVLGELVGPDCDESKVSQCPNGNLLMHSRSRPLRKQAFSDDNGNSFSSPIPHPALTDPSCNGGLARLGNLMIASGCDHSHERTNLCLRISDDDAHSWSSPIVIDPGAAAYSVIVHFNDETLGIVWEADDYQKLLFARITPETLGINTAADYTFDPSRITLLPRSVAPAIAKPPVINGESQSFLSDAN